MKSVVRQRRRDDIMLNILETANGGNVNLSQIMQRSNLTSSQTKAYLSELISKAYLEREIIKRSKQCFYRTTAKGIRYIQLIEAISDLFPTKPRKNAT